jgi:hypothetical protein
MHIDSNSYDLFPTNMLLSATSGVLAFITSLDLASTIILPVIFFVIGKGVDVAVRIYLEKRKKEK